jgi:hypothetical protein
METRPLCDAVSEQVAGTSLLARRLVGGIAGGIGFGSGVQKRPIASRGGRASIPAASIEQEFGCVPDLFAPSR